MTLCLLILKTPWVLWRELVAWLPDNHDNCPPVVTGQGTYTKEWWA